MPSPWLRTGGALLAARTVSLALLFVLPAPGGGPFTVEPGRGFLAALLAEAAFASALLVVTGLLATFPGMFSAKRALVAFAATGSLHLVLAEASQQLLRWVGQPLRVEFLVTYAPLADRALVDRVVRGDTLSFGASAAVTISGTALLLTLALRARNVFAPAGRALAETSAAAIALVALFAVVSPDGAARERARPATWALLADTVGRVNGAGEPPDLARGLAELKAFLRKPEGFAPDPRYPLWHAVPEEAAAYAGFRARPLSEKPDVVLLVMESLRGWEADFRREDGVAHLPELHRLFLERGVQFPRFHANGFPSVEGWCGIHLGLWPHPLRTLLHRPEERSLSLADILGRAGYHRVLVTGTAPGFEWMDRLYARWFDEIHYRPDESNDGALAARALACSRRRPEGKPLFLVVLTVSTHPPVWWPPDGRPPPATSRDAYLRSVAYMDASLGKLFEGLRGSPRWAQTIVVAVGDHAIPNPWQSRRGSRLGTPHVGQTWTTLVVAAPGLRGGTIREELASHVDLGPTLLGLLRLDVSNHFLGRDLFAVPRSPEAAVLGLRFGGLALTEGARRWQIRLDEPSFHLTSRWEDRPPGDIEPESGSYGQGTLLPWTAADDERAARLRAMARAYGWLLDAGRLLPPVPGR